MRTGFHQNPAAQPTETIFATTSFGGCRPDLNSLNAADERLAELESAISRRTKKIRTPGGWPSSSSRSNDDLDWAPCPYCLLAPQSHSSSAAWGVEVSPRGHIPPMTGARDASASATTTANAGAHAPRENNDTEKDGQAALEAEFDAVAAWTETVIAELGPQYAIPAACRGSGSPAWLAWFADRLAPTARTRFVDVGAGLGGPAAWLRERTGVTPVLVEPMERACVGAKRLFDFSPVAAWSQTLPFTDGTFDAGWLLGVLDTTADQAELLAELHRVLTPDALVGFLVLIQVVDELPIAPEGNDFPTPESLDVGLDFSGFEIVDRVRTRDLPSADTEWTRRVAAVEDALEAQFGHEPAWQSSREQGERLTLLLYGGSVEVWLVCATRRPDHVPLAI